MRKLEIIVCASIIVAGGCTPKGTPAATPSSANPAAAMAVSETFATATAVIRDAQGKHIGDATFSDSYAGVVVAGTVSDLGLGSHGVHIHSVGKCEPPFTTAGGHFNPTGRQHGYENQHGPHLGDLPNINTPAAGPLRFEFLLPGVTLKGQNALLDADGAAIVIHAGRDDYKTDPAGNSGARIACGVITQR